MDVGPTPGIVLGMDVIEAIQSRRSVPALTDQVPSRNEVEALLDAAVMAPTHHMTQPWRFVVVQGVAREAMGAVMGERVRREQGGDPMVDSKVAAEEARPLRAPVIIVVVYTPSDHPKAVAMEDRYSVGAAMQNILLAAHDRGLAAFLRTGPAALDPDVARHLGLAVDGEAPEEIAGFIYLGYPAAEAPPAKQRTDPRERTVWLA
ncbi:MAG TPA: nitroreductase [Actinomycetota bacterium]|nr:nitroreductase [Actinomycetota bacterium]